MRLIDWIRNAIADLLDLRRDDFDQAAEGVTEQLRAARSVAALAVAQARRCELELREALASEDAGPQVLAALVSRVEEERRHACRHVQRYHDLRGRSEVALSSLGEARRLEALNAERDALEHFAAQAQGALDDEAVSRLLDEARAEAAAQDVLDDLAHGAVTSVTAPPAQVADVRERAEALLRDEALLQAFAALAKPDQTR